MLAALGEANNFATLDLKSGYWQILLNEEDKQKMALTSHGGLYEHNVIPLALDNAPGIF